MAFDTTHACFTEMHVTGIPFVLSKEFIPHPAAVTGRAGTGHGGSAFKYMPGEESSAYIFRLADVAFTTRGVTRGAVISKHLLQLRVVFRYIPISGIDRGPVTCLRIVQAVRECRSFFCMAFSTIGLGLRARTDDQALMSNRLIGDICPCVAFDTGQLTVICLRKCFTIH